MQQKRRRSSSQIVWLVPVILLLGGMVALMMVDIPADSKPVEQVLDAKTFLESKPAQ